MIMRLAISLVVVSLAPSFAAAETSAFSVIFAGTNIGHLIAETKGDLTTVDFDYKDNGRGPTTSETIRTGPGGLPVEWSIKGATTFGSKVDEHFSQTGSRAEWADSTGKGSAPIVKPALYANQSGSPWSEQIIVRALLRAPGMSMAVLPSGTLHLEKGETLTLRGGEGSLAVSRYDLVGINLSPSVVLLDAKGTLIAHVDPTFILIRKGYEGEDQRLRKLTAEWITRRFATMEKEVAHHYGSPVRIRNVRVFDPRTSALTEPMSVLVRGKEIAALEPLASPPTPGELTVDGGGGTLIAGMCEMHAHLSQDEALLNLMAGITSVRDMGNDNAVLDTLIQRIEDGEVGGPQGRRRNWTRLRDRGGFPGRRGEPRIFGEYDRLHPVRTSRSSWTRSRQSIGCWMWFAHGGRRDAGSELDRVVPSVVATRRRWPAARSPAGLTGRGASHAGDRQLRAKSLILNARLRAPGPQCPIPGASVAGFSGILMDDFPCCVCLFC